MVDDEAAHDASGIGHESASVRELDAILIRYLYIGFVQKGRRAQVRARTLTSEFAFREAAQLRIKGAKKPVGSSRLVSFDSVKLLLEAGFGILHGWRKKTATILVAPSRPLDGAPKPQGELLSRNEDQADRRWDAYHFPHPGQFPGGAVDRILDDVAGVLVCHQQARAGGIDCEVARCLAKGGDISQERQFPARRIHRELGDAVGAAIGCV